MAFPIVAGLFDLAEPSRRATARVLLAYRAAVSLS